MYDFEAATANETCDFMLNKVMERGGSADQILKIATLVLFTIIISTNRTKKRRLKVIDECNRVFKEAVLAPTEPSDV